MIQVGVVGYGYWGPNLVRNFNECPGSRVGAICDANPDRLALARARYPSAEACKDYQALLKNPALDAIVIATPVSSHFPLALQALQAGKHVLVEKPLTASSEHAEKLIEEALRRRLVLMVDHTFVYTGAVRKMRELVDKHELGQIYYYDAVRVNLGLFQHDVSVIWDLAVHDLSIMDYVLRLRPESVSATGVSHVAGEPENIAYLTLHCDGNLIAHVHVNWLAPVKIRQTLIGGSKRMIVYDDLEPSEKLRIYDKGIAISGRGNEAEKVYKLLVSYRMGDMWAPQLDMTEALRAEVLHFTRCIEKNERPLTDGEAGLRIVRLLEAATRSMQKRSEPIKVRW